MSLFFFFFLHGCVMSELVIRKTGKTDGYLLTPPFSPSPLTVFEGL